MSLPTRLKQSPVLRAILVYLGASWVVVEAADLLQEQLGLPDWLVPVTLVLLLVGLVVVAATALVQAMPSTDRKEAAGEVPSDWELDLGDLARSIRERRLPHLTWGRALAGGVVAFLALFGLASLLVPGDGGGVRELDAAAQPGIAVLPFRASGAELEPWREGLVDLLSRNLDGVGGLRAIDSRTVLARWAEVAGDGADPDLAAALSAAGSADARWALVGSAVEVGSRVRVSADVYEVATGRRLDGTVVEGSPDSVFALVDALSVQVARTVLEEEDPDLSALRLSSITTESPAALRAYLDGESAYRRLGFREAVEQFGRAVELDSTFALAWYRLGTSMGWAPELGDASEARAQAYANRERLPDREALLVEADYRGRRGALPSGVALLLDGVRRYPDDPELWYTLGDIYIHSGQQLLVTPDEAERMLRRAESLDPGFAPYGIHLLELAMVHGDSGDAARRLAIEEHLASRLDRRQLRRHQLIFDYLFGGESGRERARAALDSVPALQSGVGVPITLDGANAGARLALANEACAPLVFQSGASPFLHYNCFWTHLAAGRLDEVDRFAADLDPWYGPILTATVGIVLRQTRMDPDAPIMDPRAVLASAAPPGSAIDPTYFVAGILALEDRRPALADSLMGVYRETATRLDADGDTLDARVLRGLAEGLEGYRALAATEADAAMGHMEASLDLLAGGMGPAEAFRTLLTWPTAELYADRGRDEEALLLLRSLWNGFHAGPAVLRRAEILDRRGETERARALYAHFLSLWRDADPEHALVRRARAGLNGDA